MDDTKLIEGVEKTGYRLEFNVSRILENHNWTVINNKYYIDDQQESIREIDILAYKVGFVDGIYFYTSLIISCKKDHEKIWALFSKKINEKDPNTDWFPVHVWTNNKAMNYTILQSSWKKKYLSYLRNNGYFSISEKPNNHIFPFQELCNKKGTPQNDKRIFFFNNIFNESTKL